MSAACRGRRSARRRAGRGARPGRSTRRRTPRGFAAAVAEIVRKQVELGIDIIDDGEFGKPSFVSYVNERLGGFEVDTDSPRQSPWAASREARSFPEFYARRPRGFAARTRWSAPRRSPTAARRSCSATSTTSRRALNGAKPARRLHAGDFARERGGLAAQRLLQDRRGVSVRGRRRDARGIRGDRAGRISAADRRSAARDLLDQDSPISPSRNIANGPRGGSRRSIMRCATSRRRRSATTPATASIWGRASTTWSSRTSSTSF